jgi:thiamine biosynthesis lipoprotein
MGSFDCRRRLGENRYCDSRVRIGMGTYIAVDAEAPDTLSLERGIEAAFQAILLVERFMHPTHQGSDLVAIHGSQAGTAVSVHPWTWEVLDICKRVHHLSHGVFDPCLPQSAGGLNDIGMPEASVVTRRAPLSLDLGGVAKGYAVDQAVGAMIEAGCTAGLVNAGGDLRVFGPQGHDVVCRDQQGASQVLHLQETALATACVDHPLRPAEHRGYYHGVRRTGIHSGSVAVIAPSAAIADALTKCLLIERQESSGALLEAFGARLVHCAH